MASPTTIKTEEIDVFSSQISSDLGGNPQLTIKTEFDEVPTTSGGTTLLSPSAIKSEQIYFDTECSAELQLPVDYLQNIAGCGVAIKDEEGDSLNNGFAMQHSGNLYSEMEIKTEDSSVESTSGQNSFKIQQAPSTSAPIDTTCYLCYKQLEANDNLLQHLMTAHPTYRYHCMVCKFSTEKEIDRLLHLEIHQRKPFKCPVCKRRFEDYDQQLVHEVKVHGRKHKLKTNELSCSVCKMLFNTESRMRQHEFYSHNIKHERHACFECGKMFYYPFRLKAHLRNVHAHGGDTKNVRKIYKCYFCETDTRMETKELLEEHLNTMHQTKAMHCCTQCIFSDHRIWSMNQHLARHDASTRPYKCTLCPTRFTTLYHALNHEVKAHDLDRDARARFPCSTCGKKYFHEYKLKLHERTEHPEVKNVDQTGSNDQPQSDIKTEEVHIVSELPATS